MDKQEKKLKDLELLKQATNRSLLISATAVIVAVPVALTLGIEGSMWANLFWGVLPGFSLVCFVFLGTVWAELNKIAATLSLIAVVFGLLLSSFLFLGRVPVFWVVVGTAIFASLMTALLWCSVRFELWVKDELRK